MMGGYLAADQTLPIIRFSDKDIEVGSSSWLSTSKDVVLALEKFGCFIATNYANFSPKLHHAIFDASHEMFDLPIHIKKCNTLNTPWHGYVGQHPILPLYEGFGIENATTEEGVRRFTDLLWPSGNNAFRETALEFSKGVAELEQVVMRMVCGVYGIRSSYQASMLETTSYLLRFMKYRVPTKDETGLGMTPHTDKSFFSILHQRQVKGLQIQTKNGDWIGVDPSPLAFIVMAGDACTGWSNGRIEASNHRVIMDGSEERYSIGVFKFIKDVKIKVPEELVDEDHPLQFEEFDHYKYIHFSYTDEAKRSKCRPIRAYCGL